MSYFAKQKLIYIYEEFDFLMWFCKHPHILSPL